MVVPGLRHEARDEGVALDQHGGGGGAATPRSGPGTRAPDGPRSRFPAGSRASLRLGADRRPARRSSGSPQAAGRGRAPAGAVSLLRSRPVPSRRAGLRQATVERPGPRGPVTELGVQGRTAIDPIWSDWLLILEPVGRNFQRLTAGKRTIGLGHPHSATGGSQCPFDRHFRWRPEPSMPESRSAGRAHRCAFPSTTRACSSPTSSGATTTSSTSASTTRPTRCSSARSWPTSSRGKPAW